MTKHTPGPWHVGKEQDGRAKVVYDSDGFEIAKVCYPRRDDNARLIAAAPEMLEALMGLLAAVQRSVCDGSGPAQSAAITAIAKATGENYAKAMGECADEDGDVMCSACNCWKATRANCS